jgi:hypothetical protein
MALNNDDIKQLIAILQRGLVTDQNEDEDVVQEQKKTTKRKSNKHKIAKSQKENKYVNKFADMPEANMHKEDSQIDKLLCRQPPVVRSREYSPINVTCRVCGKSENVHPGLVTEGASRYKCNKCSTSEG